MKNIIKRNNNQGFTIIETLVSATIMAIALVVFSSVVRKGTDMEITNKHRIQAQAIIESHFESPAYQYLNFSNLKDTTENILIDFRDPGSAADDLLGKFTVTITPDTIVGSNETLIICKEICMNVVWHESLRTEKITLKKWITYL